MKIILDKCGRKFSNQWIFRNLSYTISSGEKVWISGKNGSGKSTLLQVIAGNLLCTEGNVSYEWNGRKISDDFFSHISFTAPYLDLPDEFSLPEILRFHFKFKKRLNEISDEDLMAFSNLSYAIEKPVRNFSSGMKQRAKLLLAICTDAPILLLDEPCSNLDEEGMQWYATLIEKFAAQRTIIVASNHLKEEHHFCQRQIDIHNFKS